MDKEAPQEIRDKIRDLAARGQIASPVFENGDGLASANKCITDLKAGRELDWTFTDVQLEHCWTPYRIQRDGKEVGNDGGFSISWVLPGPGSGTWPSIRMASYIATTKRCHGSSSWMFWRNWSNKQS